MRCLPCVCVCSRYTVYIVKHLASLLAPLARDWNFTHPHTDLWPSAHKVVGAESHQSCGWWSELFVKMVNSHGAIFTELISSVFQFQCKQCNSFLLSSHVCLETYSLSSVSMAFLRFLSVSTAGQRSPNMCFRLPSNEQTYSENTWLCLYGWR